MQVEERAAAPDLSSLGPAERQALAALWARAARSAAADVPALAELVLALTALGAPPELVARAARSSAEQVAASVACARMASAYDGVRLVLDAQPALLGRTPLGVHRPRAALRRLALRALRDGCLLGGHVAQVACWASATSTDPAARAALRVVAEGEASATSVWNDVLAWCLTQQPRLVVRLRRVELAEHSQVARALAQAPGDPAVLAAHGWPRLAEVERLWSAHRAAVLARVPVS